MRHLGWASLLFLLVVSCGDEVDTSINDGWAAFQAGRYEEAQSFFNAGLSVDAPQANVGLGWTSVKLGNLAQARTFFLTSIAPDTLLGAMAGLAIVSWNQNLYQESLHGANFVLSRQSTFVFQFDPTIVASLLTLVQAYDYYHLGQFSACLSRIQVLDPAFPSTTDPQALLNKLDALSATGT